MRSGRRVIRRPRHRSMTNFVFNLLAASCPNTPHGCMLMTGAINCMRANREVEDYLRDIRSRRQWIIRRRRRRGVMEGDLPPGLDLTALASFYTTVLDGLSTQARDGASRKALRAAVGCAMAAWDKLVQSNARIGHSHVSQFAYFARFAGFWRNFSLDTGACFIDG